MLCFNQAQYRETQLKSNIIGQPIIIQETRHMNQSETFKLFTSTNQSPSNSLHQPISHIISQPGFVKSFYHQWRLSCFSQPIEFLATAVFPPIRRFNSASVKIQSQSDKSSQHFRQHRHTALKFRQSRHNVPKFSVADSALTLNQKSVC